jgi:hypothetical protein
MAELNSNFNNRFLHRKIITPNIIGFDKQVETKVNSELNILLIPNINLVIKSEFNDDI